MGRSYPIKVFKLNHHGPHGPDNMLDSSQWSLIASGTVKGEWSKGAKTPSFQVTVPAGTEQAFYISSESRGIISQSKGTLNDVGKVGDMYVCEAQRTTILIWSFV